MTDERIPELDFIRGAAVMGMIGVHFLFDLRYFGGLSFEVPYFIRFLSCEGNLLFILISGICVTFSHNSVKRGVMLLNWAILISYVTLFMDLILGYQNIRIWFGILHLLGFSMAVYPLFRSLKPMLILFLSTFLIAAGIGLQSVSINVPYLFPIGIMNADIFPGSDFFPLLPYLGWFLAGSALGKLLYPRKKSLVSPNLFESRIMKSIILIGQKSLPVYLIHQPILVALILVFQ